jgi:hypothetical protein
MATRAQVDMLYMKAAVTSMCNKTFKHMLTGNTSETKMHFVLTLVGGA